MSKPIFMSDEHVARMNEILAADAASKTACAALGRRWDMVYELGSGAGTVWWTMSFDPAAGVSFALAPPPPREDLPAGLPGDIVFRGDHREMLDWMLRSKAREDDLPPMPLQQLGDPEGMAAIAGAFAAAQKVATLDTEIPRA